MPAASALRVYSCVVPKARYARSLANAPQALRLADIATFYDNSGDAHRLWPQGGPVSRHLLDTNIIGNVAKPAPSAALVAWMAEQADEDLFISSLTVAEIRRGLLERPAGKKRKELERWFSGPEGPQALFSGRVLPFDEKAGLVWARLMAYGTAAGHPRSPLDMIVAAVAEANDCVLVTDNERDFIGLKIVNPLRLAN